MFINYVKLEFFSFRDKSRSLFLMKVS